ncbi:MAG: hypothetical protein ACTHKG_21980 [Nocardioides sp.]
MKWWKVLLLAAAGLLALFLMLVGLAFASLVGAFDSLGGDPPREGDPEVVAARQESATALQQQAALLTQSAVLPGLPPGSALLAQGEVVPPCQEGQHNWKINDDFDLVCSQSRREVVTVPDQVSFRADMVRLDESLRAQGWRPAFQPIPDVLTGYWDELAGRSGMGGTPDHVYTMADLPPAGYTRSVQGRPRTLTVSWVEHNSRGTDLTNYVTSSRFSVAGKQVEPDEVVAAVPAKGYAVVVSVSEEYFDK